MVLRFCCNRRWDKWIELLCLDGFILIDYLVYFWYGKGWLLDYGLDVIYIVCFIFFLGLWLGFGLLISYGGDRLFFLFWVF